MTFESEALRGLERRLDRLQARAEADHEHYLDLDVKLREIDTFLDVAPKTATRLDELSKALFGEILDEIEANLSHAIREILGQEREVRTLREQKNNRLHISFEIYNQGEPEDVLVGQGGSVCNILSVGLRLIALSQLDPSRHRLFLVLDEQDCWLKPELVPRFMRLIAKIADKLSIQALVISHHPLDLFAGEAEIIHRLEPSREHGVTLKRITPAPDDSLVEENDPEGWSPGLDSHGE